MFATVAGPASFSHASVAEGLAFTTLVALPNMAQGLFRPRPRVAATLNRLGVPERGRRLLARLHRRYGDGPIWVSVGGKDTLVVFGPEQIRFALSNAPDPFASDPEPKRSGMLKFQPNALTISRDPQWTDRRRFTDAVLAEAQSTPSIQLKLSRIVAEEAAQLPTELGWRDFNAAVRRIARRVILGDSAAEDHHVSEQLATLMEKANPPGKGDPELYRVFRSRLDDYVAEAETDSLTGLFANAPITDATDPAGQIIHWMFAMGDTLAINTWRCLVLLAAHPTILSQAHQRLDDGTGGPYLAACLNEAMRLWPTTAILARIVIRNTNWAGVTVAAGTQVMIVNTFNHRDTTRFPWADRFEPNTWIDETDNRNWSFNFFSNGPQACPGADLAVRLGSAILSEILGNAAPAATGAVLDPARPLPYSFNHTGTHITLKRREGL